MLTGRAIIEAIERGDITFSGFKETLVGPNSIDFHLGEGMLFLYEFSRFDYRKPVYLEKELENGFYKLHPDTLYLGCTQEIVGSHIYVPTLHGRSSIARMGISVHQTAGFGDLGFVGQWTLEILVERTVCLRPGDRIGQFSFERAEGDRSIQYQGKYSGQKGPVPSKGFA